MRNFIVSVSMAFLIAGCGSDADKTAADGGKAMSPAARAQAAASADAINRINSAPMETIAPVPVPADGASAKADAPPNLFAIRAEALLARARFSPGVVDGQFGSNLKNAIAAYQTARNLTASGTIDAQTWQALLAEPGSSQPVARGYTITHIDVAGPYVVSGDDDLVALAALPGGPQFASLLEALAERFHMSQALLLALNPGVNFAVPGTNIVVIDAVPVAFAKDEVVRVDIAKSDSSLLAYNQAGSLIAFYPATVGAANRPSPSGTHKVLGVGWNPDYTYDPAKLTWGPRTAGKLVIKPGPNNPVGTVWIDLNAPSYGIHGTPEPDKIGKTASHGCVRLTNWDAMALAGGIKSGAVVRFTGQRGKPSSR